MEDDRFWVSCPDESCGAAAVIVDQQELESTDGPMLHVATRCLTGHRFFLPAQMLPAPTQAEFDALLADGD